MKYMLTDVTAVETTRVLLVATLDTITLHGQIARADGKKVIAPPLASRSFAALDPLALKYLFWNHAQIPPADDYRELIEGCRALVEAMPLAANDSGTLALEAAAGRMALAAPAVDGATPEKKARKPRTIPAEPAARPRAGTAASVIWDTADRLRAEQGGEELPERDAVVAACVALGIVEGTASTQYSQWKRAVSAAA